MTKSEIEEMIEAQVAIQLAAAMAPKTCASRSKTGFHLRLGALLRLARPGACGDSHDGR
jgi:hypothetical protein